MNKFFTFPNPVNNNASRVVAGGVAAMAAFAFVYSIPWLLIPIIYGFAARVLTGPRFSPLALFATKVVAPNLPEDLVPGPPKRFAQGIGLVLSAGAGIALLLGATSFGYGLVFVLYGAAMMEAVGGLCLGCVAFGLLMRLGVIPERICLECSNFGGKRAE